MKERKEGEKEQKKEGKKVRGGAGREALYSGGGRGAWGRDV